MAILDVRGVSRSFEGLQAVRDLSFAVAAGSVTGIVGPNGAGKTTGFNLICGLLRASSGEIFFDGARVDRLPAYRRARAGMGRTFQDPRIFPQVSALDHVVAGACLRGDTPLWALLRDRRTIAEWRAATDRARQILEMIGLGGRALALAQDLSFGEQRFLSIGRVLAADPRLLLLDEPTVGLDAAAVERLVELIGRMVREQGKTVLLVEHNMGVVFRICDQIHLMIQGSVAESGPPAAMRRNVRMIEAYLGARHAAAGA